MKLFRKIDIFDKETKAFLGSTNQSRTCREAVLKYQHAHPKKVVVAHFSTKKQGVKND